MDRSSASDLRNIGPVSSQWLEEVGVNSRTDLERLGAVAVYAMVRNRYPRTSLNLLWALEAARRDIDWRELTDADKVAFKQELVALLD